MAPNGYKVKKSNAKREYHDENVSLKADRALSNFFFHLESETIKFSNFEKM